MLEMTTIPKEELANLEARVKKLAIDKSYLQLIIRLMNRMNSVPGLDNTVETMLKNVVDVIGGTNVILYYLIDDDIYYADVYGERKKLAGVADNQVKEVMETREPFEFEHEFNETQMMTPEFSKAYTWVVPLVVGAELVGVFKMESLNITIRDLYQQLPTFFTYAALVLKNEILGHTRLKQANDRLEQEVVVRQRAEEELRQTNEVLELRVAERIAELCNANEQLRENEKQIKSLLDKSEQSRRALLGILEDEKQAKAALQRERALLSRIMETSPVGITMVDRDGQVTFANPQTEKVLGLTKDAITQRAYNAPDWRITDYEGGPFPDEELPFQQVMSTRQPVHDVQHAIVWPDGRRILLSINGAPLLNEAGEVENVVCTIEDVTERKQAEKALHRLNRELRAISDCNQTLMRAEDEQTLLNDICRIVCEEAGYRLAWVGYAEHDEARTVHPAAWGGFDGEYVENAKLSWAEDTERGRGPGGTAIRSGEIVYIQDFTSDPRMAPWRESALQRGFRSMIGLPLRDENANVFGVLLIYSTEINAFTADEIRLLDELAGDLAFGIVVLRARAERRRAEDALRESEHKLGEAARIAHVGYWDRDYVAESITLSDEACQIFGLPLQYRFIKLPEWHAQWLNLIHPEDQPKVTQVLTEALAGGSPYKVDYRIVRSDGEVRYIHSYAELTRDKSGKPLRMFGTMIDITERKRAEEALRESETKFRAVFESSVDAIGVSKAGSHIFVNPAYLALFGYADNAELSGKPILDLIAPSHRAQILENVRRRASGQPVSTTYETRGLRKDGSEFDMDVHVSTYELNGEVYTVPIIRDITERKRTEDTIRASNDTLESRLLALTQPVGNVSNIQLNDLFNIDELQKIQDAFALATGVASIITDTQGTPITKPSNFCRLCEYIIRKTEKGLLNCYHSDATLGRMNPKEPILQRCLSGGLWDAGTSIYVGDQHIANWLIGQVLEEPVDEEAMLAYAGEIGANEEEFRKALSQVTRMPLKQFKEITKALYLIANQLSKLAIQNVQQARFITERKQAEENLRQMNERFSLAARAARLGVWDWDIQKDELAWDDGMYELYGVKREDFAGAYEAWLKGIHPDDRAPSDEISKQAQRGEREYDTEFRVVWPDGSLHYLKAYGQFVRDADGKPLRMTGVNFDITERKQAEETLRTTKILLEQTFEQSPVPMILVSMPDVILRYVNPAARYFLGIDDEPDLTNTPLMDLKISFRDFDLQGKEGFLEELPLVRSLKGIKTEGEERYIIRKDGTIRYELVSGAPIFDDTGQLIAGYLIMADITERKQAEDLLRKREQEFRTLAENSPDVIVRYDREGRRIYVNPEFERVNHLSAQEVQGKTPVELSTELAPKADVFTEKLMAAMASGSVAMVDLSWIRDGKLICWYVRIVPEFDANGKVVSALTIWSDISERKRVEEALHQSEERFRRLAENARDVIYRMSIPDGKYEYVSSAVLSVFGYSPEECYETPILIKQAIHPNWQMYFEEQWANLIKGEMPPTYEYQFIHKSGGVRWLNQRNILVRDNAENPIAIEGIVTDITERKRAEDALQESERRYRDIFDNVLDGLYLLDVTEDNHFRTVEVNPALERLTGVPRSFSVGKTQEETVPAEVAAIVNAKYRHCVEAGHPIEEEAELDLPAGRRYFHSTLIPTRDETGEIHSIIGISRDITERKQAEEKIRKLNQELEQRVLDRTAELENANKELEAFAYSVSHDLRAPLRHIDGFLELLQKKTTATLDEQGQHYMANISEAARRMGILIDDLLSFSRMGRNEMSKAQLDLGELVQDVIQEFNPEIEGRDIQWNISRLPMVAGDRAMLKIVLVNLISNALKFTRSRSPAKIEIGFQSQEAETIVFVRDNGVGFDMNYADKLFGVFQRLHRADEFDGTGIGLANVRRVINRHGGRTWAEGEVGQGATFYFSLPQTLPGR